MNEAKAQDAIIMDNFLVDEDLPPSASILLAEHSNQRLWAKDAVACLSRAPAWRSKVKFWWDLAAISQACFPG